MIRAAAKTLQGFSMQHQTLQSMVIDSLPLAHLHPGNARPEGWDSEAFCSNLQSAYLGVHGSETFPNSRAPICSLIRDFEQGRVKGGLQAKVSLLLKSYHHEYIYIYIDIYIYIERERERTKSNITPKESVERGSQLVENIHQEL